jgi:general secretion pathway protein K
MWRNLKTDRRSLGRDEDGVVLLLVLLILTLISVLVLSWAQDWRTELQLAANFREAHQCQRLAEAGVYYSMGKLLEAKVLETTMGIMNSEEGAAKYAESWRGDQMPRLVRLPGGMASVTAGDEGGKININRATGETLTRLFLSLGFPQTQVPIMVDSLLDWRSRGEEPRPNGAKSAYYRTLDPPYVSRDGPFEAVEELAWVRGFETTPLIPRLADYLTAQDTGSQGININTAPLEVLIAAGIPPDAAQAIVTGRQQQPFTNYQDILQLSLNALPGQQFQRFTFQSSPFFTIKSTGMVKKDGGRQTVKAIVRLDMSLRNGWEVLSWVDDYPG